MEIKKKYKSFTLLELLLAVSVFAVLTTMAAGALYSFVRSWKMQQEEAENLRYYYAMERVADRVLRSMVPMHWLDENGEKKPVFLGDPRLMITAFRQDPEKNQSAIAYAAIGLRDDKLWIQYRNEPILYFKKDPLPRSLHEELLCPDVQDFSILYAEYENGELVWQTDWNEDERDLLPLAIAWIVTFKDGETVKFIRRTTGVSYYSSFGRRNDVKLQ